jgi:shikimate dehydrogenase
VKAAVLGSPIAHSLSPVLHRAAYEALGLTGWSYRAIECDEARLPGLLAGCGPGWAGLSLTMPLKRAVLPLLDSIAPLAAGVGAVNTVVFSGERRHGHNTDVPGMIDALAAAGGAGGGRGAPGAVADPAGAAPSGTGAAAAAGAGAGTDPGEVLIVGAGATACSALAAVRELGGREATVAARDASRAGGLLAAAERLRVAVRLADFDDPGVPAPDLLISTVPTGAADVYAKRLTGGSIQPGLIFDVVYAPWPTPLAEAAGQAGVSVVGGFELLLHQAARQVDLMTGKPAPVEVMRAAGLAELAKRVGHG